MRVGSPVKSARCYGVRGCTARIFASGANEVQGEEAALGANKRGPKPDGSSTQARRTLGLEREVSKLRSKLHRAEQIIEAQKKLCDLLGLPSAEELQR